MSPAELKDFTDYMAKIAPAVEFVNQYSLRNMKSHEERRGVEWSAELYFGDNWVAKASNDGDGGCNHYDFQNSEERKAFDKAVRKAYPDDALADETFLSWLDMTMVISQVSCN
jgi:hypothetical protein